VDTFSAIEGLKPGYVIAYAGSSDPLHFTVLAYTSKEQSYVTADPGYEAGMHAATLNDAKIVKVPLAADHSHDVKAMVAADPNAGVFYICNPNNPTGTITSKDSINYALANKPKGSILLIDEAYIHFSDATSSLDLVKADQDVIVLRTFSKIYGMAGMRCGFAIGRPDLLDKVQYYGMNFNPIMAVSAAIISLQDKTLIPTRKKINSDIRAETFAWLEKNNYKYIPSQTNCFMLHAGRPGREMMSAMAQRNVFIGRVWPIMPEWVRITVGTSTDMARFRTAWHEAMQAPASSAARLEPPELPALLARTPFTHLS
jgi:histidinol-phosphate aminotransferase